MTGPRHGQAAARPVADVLADIASANQHIGPLAVELLNTERGPEQAARLRELGEYLGSLAAELLARAAEIDGRAIEPPRRVVIDATE